MLEKASEDFQVFVKPVGAICNLACKYCYYLETQNLYSEESGQRMPVDLLEEYIIQHIGATSGSGIFFSWHGGEPTLAGLQYFQQIVELQHKHQPENCHIVNGIQTNGTLLTDEWCRFFAKENFFVGISIDGPENLHSIYRNSNSGTSHFNDVIRGYQLLKSYGIKCEILCVVNAGNVLYPLQVYQFFKELKVEFISFIPLVEKQTSGNSGVSERSVNAKEFGEFLCTIFDEWRAFGIGTVKIQIFEEAMRTAFNQDHTLCIFKPTCGNVPVIEYNGDFYSCDHFVRPEYLIGNIKNESLVNLLESPGQKAFGQSKLTSLPVYCLNCDVIKMCNGACPKDRFISTPDGEANLNYLCEGYKLFFNHCKPFVDAVAAIWKSDQAQ